MKIVRVTWRDSASGTGWTSEHPSEMEPSTCVSVGFLASKTRKQVVVTQSTNDFGHFAESLVIPRSVVQSIEYLVPK